MSLFIQPTDLRTHIYNDVLSEITREDTTITQEAISAGIAEAKGFLSAFILPQIFGTEAEDPTINDPNLKSKVKDLIRWHLVILGSPYIDYNDAKTRYEYAIEYYFKPIQSGNIVPEAWPYKYASAEPSPPQGNAITWSSNPKRNNYY